MSKKTIRVYLKCGSVITFETEEEVKFRQVLNVFKKAMTNASVDSLVDLSEEDGKKSMIVRSSEIAGVMFDTEEEYTKILSEIEGDSKENKDDVNEEEVNEPEEKEDTSESFEGDDDINDEEMSKMLNTNEIEQEENEDSSIDDE